MSNTETIAFKQEHVVSQANDYVATMYLVGNFCIYFLSLALALADVHLFLRIVGSIVHGVSLATAFIIGHDCVHNSFFTRRWMNRWGGRLSFGLNWHSISLWKQVHNVNHHGRTNLRGVDDVWAPFSKSEFDKLPLWRQVLERIYRSPFGHLIYYQFQYLLPKVIFPVWGQTRKYWKNHIKDTLFVLTYGSFLIGLTIICHILVNPQGSLIYAFIFGGVLPFFLWNSLTSFTIYIQHTNPDVHWYEDEADWSHHNGQIRGTVDTTLPLNLVPLYSEVLRHTAHHDNPTVPVYNLPQCQERLNRLQGNEIVKVRLGLNKYRDILRRCKLYDFQRQCWTDFEGKQTGPTLHHSDKENPFRRPPAPNRSEKVA